MDKKLLEKLFEDFGMDPDSSEAHKIEQLRALQDLGRLLETKSYKKLTQEERLELAREAADKFIFEYETWAKKVQSQMKK